MARKYWRNNNQQPAQAQGKPLCRICKKAGRPFTHKPNDCYFKAQNNQQNNNNKGKPECQFCKKTSRPYSHHTNNCHYQNKSSQQNHNNSDNSGSDDNGREPPSNPCKNCNGQLGSHYDSDCPSLSQNSRQIVRGQSTAICPSCHNGLHFIAECPVNVHVIAGQNYFDEEDADPHYDPQPNYNQPPKYQQQQQQHWNFQPTGWVCDEDNDVVMSEAPPLVYHYQPFNPQDYIPLRSFQVFPTPVVHQPVMQPFVYQALQPFPDWRN
ncbi:hypothetical protein B0O99DRAFT_716109 [Bisporella sp. PMI_857]|nr:hypothetical protein B0O99DRAFT_716109 [Bisporella sp. PMI_857]